MGLGLDDFLKHGEESAKRKWLKDWKKDGSKVVWVSTRASFAYPSWTHAFNYIEVVKNEKTGKEEEKLRFNRFVSPDPEVVHQSQFFRDDDTDRMKIPPRLDPFLLLREWLRFECTEPLDATVFEWYDAEEDKRIKWTRGALAKLVDKTRKTWNHNLDSKLEYLMVIVDHDNPSEGLQIARIAKLLGDKMKTAIKSEVESNGDNGNPMLNPYAFKWVYDEDAKSMMDSYNAFRFNKATLNDKIRELITATEFPDPSGEMKPRPGDKAKIRAAMEDAAKIEIPWDRIFVPEWKDEAPEGGTGTDFDFGANKKGKETKKAERAPDVSTKAEEPKETPRTREEPKASAPAPEAAGTGPKTRKKKEPEKPKEPEVEKIPCDDCGHPLLPTEAKCPKCGVEYEIDVQPAKVSSGGDLSTSEKPEKCWSCGSTNITPEKCKACGVDMADDIDF